MNKEPSVSLYQHTSQGDNETDVPLVDVSSSSGYSTSLKDKVSEYENSDYTAEDINSDSKLAHAN
ncbi:hypothetical protein LPJ62_004296, partial [Coemansia sp. RSA 2167]